MINSVNCVERALSVWPDMIHVWHFFGFLLAEGRAALREAGEYLRDHLA